MATMCASLLRLLVVYAGGEATSGVVVEQRLVAHPRMDEMLHLHGCKARNGLG